HDPARAEDDLLPAALMNRPVADQPDVASQQVFVRIQNLPEVLRAGLLLTLEDELQARVERLARGSDGIEGRHDGEDRRLVVGCRTRVDPPLRTDPGRVVEGYDPAVALDRAVTQHGAPGRRRPFLRVKRLAVVV